MVRSQAEAEGGGDVMSDVQAMLPRKHRPRGCRDAITITIAVALIATSALVGLAFVSRVLALPALSPDDLPTHELFTSGDGVHNELLASRPEWREHESSADPSANLTIVFIVQAANQQTTALACVGRVERD